MAVKKKDSITDRNSAFEEMTPATRKLATKYSKEFGRSVSDRVLTYYAFAQELGAVVSDEEKYGANADLCLATYLSIEGGVKRISALRRWSDVFDSKTVKAYSTRPTSSGSSISVEHWLILSRLEDEDERQKMLDYVMDTGVSSDDLHKKLKGSANSSPRHGGGRPHKKTGDPYLDLNRGTSLAQRLNNWAAGEVYEELMANLEGMDPEKIDTKLVNAMRVCATEFGTTAQTALGVRNKVIAILKEVQKVRQSTKAAKAAKTTRAQAIEEAPETPAANPRARRRTSTVAD